jgi:cytochrome d ubiquinol oxidase subunit II
MDLYQNLLHRPWTLILVLAMAGGFGGSFYCMRRQQDLPAFLGSCCFIAAILAATMAGNYPVLLRSTLNPEFSLTSMNAATGSHGLRVGLAWWSIGIILAALYFSCLFWSFRGKVSVEAPKSEH